MVSDAPALCCSDFLSLIKHERLHYQTVRVTPSTVIPWCPLWSSILILWLWAEDFGGTHWQGSKCHLQAWADKNYWATKIHKDILLKAAMGLALWGHKKALHKWCPGCLEDLIISLRKQKLWNKPNMFPGRGNPWAKMWKISRCPRGRAEGWRKQPQGCGVEGGLGATQSWLETA